MIGPSGNFVIPGKPSTVFVEPIIGSTLMARDESIYSLKVKEYNLALSRGMSKPNPVHFFAKTADEFKDSVSSFY